MTCLSIIQSASARLGLIKPTFAFASQDLQIQQLLELLNEEGQELANRTNWTVLDRETSFTTVASIDQGPITTIAPGFSFIINDTIWNRSLRRPVFGPRTPQEWQQQLAFAINGPWSNFRIENNVLRMFQVPVAGQSCYFEYASKNWVSVAATPGATSAAWTADGDTSLLDEQLMTLGLIWRFRSAKGLPYAEDQDKYEKRVMNAIARDGGKDALNLDNAKYDIFPGVVVPSGSWGT